MGRRTYKPADEQEAAFQTAYTHWTIHKDKKSYDEIWMRIYAACEAMAKTMLKVPLSDDVFHDRLMEAVEKVIHYTTEDHLNRQRRMVPPTRPRKLITYVALPVSGSFFGPKAIKEDTEVSYEFQVSKDNQAAVDILGYPIDAMMSDYEDVKGICRKELMTTED